MSAREEIFHVVASVADGTRPWYDEIRGFLDAYRAEVLREAADTVAELREETFLVVAEYPIYDNRQKWALSDAESKLRRMADNT